MGKKIVDITTYTDMYIIFLILVRNKNKNDQTRRHDRSCMHENIHHHNEGTTAIIIIL